MNTRQAKDEPAHLIGLDLGTSAIKGVRMRSDGRILKTAGCPVHYQHPHPQWVEADAGEHERAVVSVIRELASASPVPVAALAASAASGNTLLTDMQGQPLGPVINWMDKRCAGKPPSTLHGITSESVRQTTGWPCVDSFPLAHLAWLREHAPETFTQAAHIGMNTDWLLFRLCDRWMMDYSTATTFHLQDQAGHHWHRPYLDRLGIRESQLSLLVPSGYVAGPLTARAAADTGLSTDTLAVTGSFDHPAGARGIGITAPGELLLSCGTSWVGFTPFDDRNTILDSGMLCDPFLSPKGGPWAGIFSVPAIGPVIDWYIDHLIAPDERERLRIFDEAAAAAPAGAEGLEIDLLAPPKAIDADRTLVSRAVMEGAARALNGHLVRLRKHGFSFSKATLIGGPSKSPVWPAIMAAETGLDITVGSAHAGAKGAAMLAAEGAGIPILPGKDQGGID